MIKAPNPSRPPVPKLPLSWVGAGLLGSCFALYLIDLSSFAFLPYPLKALIAAGVAYAGFRSGSATVTIQPQIVRQCIADLGNRVSEQEWSRLASEASVRTDAHLVKYVSSAMMASDRDPEATGLYFAAAERLLKLWQEEIPDDQIVNSLTAGRAV